MKTKSSNFRIQAELNYNEQKMLERHVHDSGESKTSILRRALFFYLRHTNANQAQYIFIPWQGTLLKKTTIDQVAEGELFFLVSRPDEIWIRGKHIKNIKYYAARK